MPTNPEEQEKLWVDMYKSFTEGALLCCGTKPSGFV